MGWTTGSSTPPSILACVPDPGVPDPGVPDPGVPDPGVPDLMFLTVANSGTRC